MCDNAHSTVSKLKESLVQSKIISYLKAIGAYTVKTVVCSTNGHPDILAAVPYTITQGDVGRRVGLFVGVEVKNETGKASPIQVHRLSQIEEAGGIGLVARSVSAVETALFDT